MVTAITRPISDDERDRLREALWHEQLATRNFLGVLLTGRRAAARLAADTREVTVVSVSAVGVRFLMPAKSVPGDRGALLIELEDGGLLVMASDAVSGILDLPSKTPGPHEQMTWVIGPKRIHLDYHGSGLTLRPGRHAMATAAADAVLQHAWARIDGHVIPGKLATCEADVERYVTAPPEAPRTVPVPSEHCGLPAEALPDD
ncbi:MAG: hypothetical protein HZB16_08500 [Armatimonadetes bacterium]|nr:hypothetical protein [Armatimonadota bacterium]